MAHLLISAAHKSSGKTTLSLGLMAVFRARGLVVQPFKKGPDYIDPIWHGIAAGRPSFNLDFNTMSAAEISALFARRGADADICVVEGNKGLYDGVALDGSNSNAALARLLGAPVVLVIDTRGMTRGIAPLVLGYRAFEPAVRIGGVILNHVGGPRHEQKLRAVLEHYTDVPVLGAVTRDSGIEIAERHLGLVPGNEHAEARRVLARIADAVRAQVDVDALAALAQGAGHVAVPPAAAPPPATDIRIGIARDAAFGFYYPDDLQALREAGAELIEVDMIRDHDLPPALDGLFIGGGFPEVHMDALSANGPMRAQIASAVEAGLPVHAECGGLMYLAREIRWNNRRAQMAGVLPVDVVMHARPQGRGYVRLCETAAHPWPGGGPAPFNAHEFHYSRLENVGEGIAFAYAVERGYGVDGRHDGLVYRNVLASYSHLRDAGTHRWARRFAQFVRACRASGAGARREASGAIR